MLSEFLQQQQKHTNGTSLQGMFRDLVAENADAQTSTEVEDEDAAPERCDCIPCGTATPKAFPSGVCAPASATCSATSAGPGCYTKCAAGCDCAKRTCSVKLGLKPITCKFTFDNNVDSVFYAGKDITGSVKGNPGNWKAVKQVTIKNPVDNAYLVIAGHNHENDGRACKTGGFMIQCDNGINSGSMWDAYGSDRAIYGSQTKGEGSRWTTPCQSSSGFYLADGKKRINVRKIFATNKKFGAFRIMLRGAPKSQPKLKDPITCTFTIDNFVDSVYYDGKDITRFVAGNLRNWNSVKRVTVEKKTGAYFVVSGHNHERNSCKTGGFQIKCSNGVTSSNPKWQAFGSDRAVYGPQKDGRGGGWKKPCASGSGFKLKTAPKVKKIFATNKQFASFRIQLVPKKKKATTTTTTTTTNTAMQVIKVLGEKLKASDEKLQSYKSQFEETSAKLKDCETKSKTSTDKLKREEAMNKQLETVISATRAERERWKERTENVGQMYKESQKHNHKLQKSNTDLYKVIVQTRAKAPTMKALNGGWDRITAAKQAADEAKKQLRGLGGLSNDAVAPVPLGAPSAAVPKGAPPVAATTAPKPQSFVRTRAALPHERSGAEEEETGPPHWHSRIDPHSGKTFYTNTVTGEMTWDPPKCWDEAYYMPPQQPCVY